MTKALKRRFIITAMIAITLLLAVLLGIINIANYWFADAESDKILNILSDPQPDFPPRKPLPGSKKPESSRIFSPPNENTRLSAIQFTVEVSDGTKSPDIDLSRISTLSENEATSLFKKALSENAESGKIDSFKYKRLYTPDGKMKYVFLDTTTQRHFVLRVLAFSLLAGLFVWLIMLLIVILLSHRAIAPIAKNFEKQKQFVTDAGHEIKTPLAIILANTEALELHSGENKWSKNIKDQVSRLNGLMQNLLTLSKSDEENVYVPKAEFNLSQVLTEISDMFKEPATQRALTLDCTIPDEISVFSNKEHISRIISSLLDNSVKYAKERSTVVIKLHKTEKYAEIFIKNECESLPSCNPEKLFDRFYREDSARTQKNGGYGIGLSAAQALAMLCGGNISAKYEKESAISFTLRI